MYRLKLFLLFQISISFGLFGQQPFCHHLNRGNGLADQSVTSFYQDELGFIWIGTRDGLNIYDGNTMKTINPNTLANSHFDNAIFSICGDGKGHIFIGNYTGVMSYDIHQERLQQISNEMFFFLTYANNELFSFKDNIIFTYSNSERKFVPNIKYSESKVIPNYLYVSSLRNKYVGTKQGLFIILNNGQIKRFFQEMDINYIFEDHSKNLWLGTQKHGVVYCTQDGIIIKHITSSSKPLNISDNSVRSICEDKTGNIWIGTQRGLNQIDKYITTSSVFINERTNPFSISNSSIHSVFCDKQGTIWVGSYYGGVDFFNLENSFYHYYGYNNDPSASVINEMTTDSKKNLWVCAENYGLICFDSHSMRIKKQIYSSSGLGTNKLKSILYDEDNNALWIGTNLYGLCKINLSSGSIKRFEPNKGLSSLRDGFVRRIVKYKNNLFLGTHYSVDKMDIKSEVFTTFLPPEIDRKITFIQDITIDKNGILWMCGNRWICKYDIEKKQVHLTESDTLFYKCLFSDKNNNIWCGTDNKGVIFFDAKSENKKYLNSLNSKLPSDKIIDITQGNSDYITIATSKGISFYNPTNSNLINIAYDMIFPLITVNEFGLHYTSDGTLYIGGSNGLFSFNEQNALQKKDNTLQIVLTDLYVNNKRITAGQDGIMENSISYANKIILKSQHTSIRINFTIPDFTNANYELRYKLKGFDKEWFDVSKDHSITYSNLFPGSYILVIQNTRTNQSRELTIVVKPAIYKTWYAFLSYFIIFGVIFIFFLKNYRDRVRLNASLIISQKKEEQIKELNEIKLSFFTNITHEFKTPLTLIICNIEMIMQAHELHENISDKLQKMLNNAHRLKRLITELIEFRKQEQGYLKLHVSELNVISFVENTFNAFKELAFSREIEYELITPNYPVNLWFDSQQLEKVVVNLLTNAFKHTTKHQKIILSIETSKDQKVIIKVSDTGEGIPPEHLNKIFNRFYQVDNELRKSDMGPGSGIGLALSEGIVKDHGGSILVESNLQKGTSFTIELPFGNDHFTKEQISDYTGDEIVNSGDVLTLQDDYELQGVIMNEDDGSVNLNLPKMVIVEDNLELLSVLKNLFISTFQVYTAVNGEEGIVATIAHQPDIVLSDVLMPLMSGIEMCSFLKSKDETCHIPVVLLTAQTGSNFIIEGLENGADDYIEKPFDSNILKVRCNNIVNSRKKLQEKFLANPKIEVETIADNIYDRELLKRAIDIISENISNPNLNVEFLASEMAMSKSSLYTKLNGITGQTVNNFILNIKLKQSTEYMQKQNDKSITEISEMFGFNSSSYFDKCFKNAFNMTPLAYKKSCSFKFEEANSQK